jgi:hypothetical protein
MYTSGTSTLYPYEIEEDYCGLFYTDSLSSGTLSPMFHYKSRAEKLGSNLFGKNVIWFGDSLSKYALYLMQDWGLNMYGFGEGGSKMGYTSLSTWLCRNTAIQAFKDDSTKPTDFDFIINMDGTNDAFPETSDTEMQFVYNNKNWYDRNLETDPFDSLSAEDKARFTGTACYLVAFYSLAQLYPKAQAVIVNPYFNRTGTDGYSNGKWASINVFSTKLLNYTPDGRTTALEYMANMLNAIYVPNQVAVGFLNAPSCITDGTHVNNRGHISKAWSIAVRINFSADYTNSIV